MKILRSLLPFVAAPWVVGAPLQAQASAADLAAQVSAILRENCAVCHTPGSRSLAGVEYEGTLNSILDFAELREQGFVDLASPRDSELYLQVADGEMPPSKVVRTGHARLLHAEELATVLAWIEAGAPDVGGLRGGAAARVEHGDTPASAGREAFLAACTECHVASRALNKIKTLSAWHSTVERMADKSGARVPREDMQAIAAYLAEHSAQERKELGSAHLTLDDFLESVELHGALSAAWRDSGRDQRIENNGFVAEAWLSVGWHSRNHPLSARVSACTTCHTSAEPEGRPIEIVEAALRLDLDEAFGAQHSSVQAAIDAGRLVVPFGAFAAQSNPAAYRTVTRPLIYNMGQMVDRAQLGPSVLPMPYSDEGVAVHFAMPVIGDVSLDLDVYAVNGLQGTLDVDFFASRAFADNNGDPAIGGRLVLGVPEVSIGVSAMSGNLEDSAGGVLGRLGYEILGVDFSARLGKRLRILAEAARRENDQVTFMPANPRGEAQVEGYVVEADLLLLEDAGVSLISRVDTLRYEGTIAPFGSGLANNFRTTRYTWGFDFEVLGGNLMINHEHWSMPAGFASVDIVGARWVVSF